jgi:hypothetical protein
LQDVSIRYGGKKQLITMLHLLSKESNKHVAKKDRMALKSAFRDVLATIEDRQPPELKLKFQQRVYTFDSWGTVVL